MKFHFLVLLILGISCTSTRKQEAREEPYMAAVEWNGLEKLIDASKKPFYHGVASGDPLNDAVIIWTRVTPDNHQRVKVIWQISADPEIKNIIKEGEIFTGEFRDYTVKVDVTGLEPGKFYYYRFISLGKTSPVGRTKTIPLQIEHLKLGFASCSNYSWGYFNAYDLMAKDTLDAVIHLGDYIYEHEENTYAHRELDRKHIPKHEIVSLTDYRVRYSQYRLDKNLQHAHAAHPFITVWDDHELSNNAYDEGASNHQENEGEWKKRLEAAKKAYYEWMPVRENNDKLYRSFTFGQLANLSMLDTRVQGRDQQVSIAEAQKDTSRKMIDQEQYNWLVKEINKPVKWKIIGNQVLFGPMTIFFNKQGQLYDDGWDDYPFQQKKLFEEMAKLNDVIIVTGDFHSSFALKNMYKGKQVATEYVVPSISSANYDEDFGKDSAAIYHSWYMRNNNQLTYADLINHGYFVLELNQEHAKGIFKFVDEVAKPVYIPIRQTVIEK